MWVGEAGRRKGESNSKKCGDPEHQRGRPKVFFSEEGRVSVSLVAEWPSWSCTLKWRQMGSSVHNSCQAILEYLLLEDFFSKEKECWEGFWFYPFVRLWITLFVLWGIKVLQLWEITFCLTGIHKQISSLNVRIGLVTLVCHLRECVSLSFQIVLALLLSGKTFLAL